MADRSAGPTPPPKDPKSATTHSTTTYLPHIDTMQRTTGENLPTVPKAFAGSYDDFRLRNHNTDPIAQVPSAEGLHDFNPLLHESSRTSSYASKFLPKYDSSGRHPSNAGSFSAFHWSRASQRGWLLYAFIWRWLLTAALCGASAGLLCAYERKWILQNSDKHVFNFVVVALAIAIGVNMAGALAHMAEKSRWFFLSLTSLPPDLFEMVMEIDKQTKVLKLMWYAKGRWAIRIICVFWICLNLAAQVGPALFGLSYAVTDPSDVGSTHIAGRWGNSSVPELRTILPGRTSSYQSLPKHNADEFLNIQRSAANAYGQSTADWWDENFTWSSFGLATFTNYLRHEKHHHWLWAIRFLNYPPADTNILNPSNALVSDRWIETAAVCEYVDPQDFWVNYTLPSHITWYTEGTNHTANTITDIYNATTYISDTVALSSRETRVMVFWSGIQDGQHRQALYKCYSKVFKVLNYDVEPVRDDMQLPDEQARIIAGAIGWDDLTISRVRYQTQTYSTGSRWSFNTLLKPWGVADNYISRFAIGALNAMNFEGPRHKVENVLLPNGGQVLTVEWNYVGAVFGALVGAHLLLVIIADLLLSRVLVRDDSPYATAVFLRPLIRNIPQGTGNILRGEEIAKTVGRKYVTYTWDEKHDWMQQKLGLSESQEKDSDGVRYLRARTADTPIERKVFDTGLYD